MKNVIQWKQIGINQFTAEGKFVIQRLIDNPKFNWQLYSKAKGKLYNYVELGHAFDAACRINAEYHK